MQKDSYTLPLIRFMCQKNALEGVLAIVWYPGKLSAVVVKEARRKADSTPGGDVCESGIMIRTVEVLDFS